MGKDKLFAKKKPSVNDFDFGKQTAAVFDDMLLRSVPFYVEIQRMTAEFSADFAKEGSSLYDLGCSTCTTFLMLDPFVHPTVRFIGVDASPDMLEKAREKLEGYSLRHTYELLSADLNQGIALTNASVVIMTLTLQFIRPLQRAQLMRDIVSGMNKGGCLILVEKAVSKDSTLNRQFIKYYHAFKERQGYSKLEISQKREALENVLIPYRVEENIELLLESGFSWCELFFKWYNFCGFIAVK